MPRRSVLTAQEKETLLSLPLEDVSQIRYYTLDGQDLERVWKRHGEFNRLGFAVQLCYFRYPGMVLAQSQCPPEWLLDFVAKQIDIDPIQVQLAWTEYALRVATRREHVLDLQSVYGYSSFTQEDAHQVALDLAPLALESERGIVIARALVGWLRDRKILLPSLLRIESLCAQVITQGKRQIYRHICQALPSSVKTKLEALLVVGVTVAPHESSEIENTQHSMGSIAHDLAQVEPLKAAFSGPTRDLAPGDSPNEIPQVRELAQVAEWFRKGLTPLRWLTTPPAAPTPRQMLEHIERLRCVQNIELSPHNVEGIARHRISKIAREGLAMSAQDLAKLEVQRRLATLTAMVLEIQGSLLDEIVELQDRIVGLALSRAKRAHVEHMGQAGQEWHHQARLYALVGSHLIQARKSGADPFEAIEKVMPWAQFEQSVAAAQAQGPRSSGDFLERLSEHYTTLHRFAPRLLAILPLVASPASHDLLQGVETLRDLAHRGARKIPKDAPLDWVPKRWRPLVCAAGSPEEGIDRRFYEMGLLCEMKNALRSGDIWVRGSRSYKEFDEYLMSISQFGEYSLQDNSAPKYLPDRPHAESLATTRSWPLPVEREAEAFLTGKALALTEQMEQVEALAKQGALPQATLGRDGLKIAPLKDAVPEEAHQLMQALAAMMPRVKITDLLLEVEAWTGFLRHFTHLKTAAPSQDTPLLLSAILADGLNLGLTKMAAAAPDLSFNQLSWLYSWHVREDTYRAALAHLVDAQFKQPLAQEWGQGKTSSSDGQRFRAGSQATRLGTINPKYGSEAGHLFYTHISDQYIPFHSQVISTNVRDATYVLDGMLGHQAQLPLQEHYTDTAGFTDHVFALMHLLGFQFAPRIRDLADKKLVVPTGYVPEALTPMCAGTINHKLIHNQWDQILRLALSIQQGHVTASLLLRKLGAYPRQNALATALREVGRIERTLFTLQWLQDIELRRRVQIGLNKGEARNALARAVFFHRLGEVRDRSFENQSHRASGLTLLTAAIILWNTVYLDRALTAYRKSGHTVNPDCIAHLSPLGWEHINLTGDYSWNPRHQPAPGKFRPLRHTATKSTTI